MLKQGQSDQDSEEGVAVEGQNQPLEPQLKARPQEVEASGEIFKMC